jgi:membrane-associated phospholipid phosphatase
VPSPRSAVGEAAARRDPFVAWPGWPHLRTTALLSLANTLWFLAVYGGMDALTARRSLRVPIHCAAELRIPFIPAMTAFYMSLYLMFALAPFVLRTRREIRAFILTLAVAILCGGVGFLLIPAELAFAPPREADLGAWAGLFHLADTLNLTYNLVPSLHVTFAAVCASVLGAHASTAGKVLLWTWAVLIAASTVLIHQHYLLDVATGWMLAVVAVRFVYRRLASNP